MSGRWRCHVWTLANAPSMGSFPLPGTYCQPVPDSSFYAYPVLIFRTGIPFGVVLHPVDVGLAICGGDGDERRSLCHALRGDKSLVGAAPCIVGNYLAGIAVGGGEVRQAHGADA